ncbi:hypothetical protein ABT095_28480 [Kitasatospora sp. NPDC002227]|uniref:hypothetical protein n=1 Tax=Kitasatospora sp. NPDC002227 TaxID=3154773 RepID=UPI0033172378
MDIVYLSLEHRPGATRAVGTEAAQVLDTLWAHATAEDGLEHASARTEPGRLDLLLFLLPSEAPDTPDATHRAAALLTRCHRNSRALKLRYLPPAPALSTPGR